MSSASIARLHGHPVPVGFGAQRPLAQRGAHTLRQPQIEPGEVAGGRGLQPQQHPVGAQVDAQVTVAVGPGGVHREHRGPGIIAAHNSPASTA